MKRILLLLSVLLCGLFSVRAQTRQITGKVTDKADGQPVIGASVTVKGATQGASTGVDGTFRLTAATAGNVVLVVKYIGYKELEVTVPTSQTVVNVAISEESVMLNEVVAVGYATVNRRDLTGSVSSVSAKQLKDIPINSTAEALAGRLAGVQVTGTEGTPNAEFQIRVRGGGSITQDNSPLYVVDGIQVQNALSVLSPQDIESIDVLKDASSTAIYGARGANGVVIITTKGGKEMKSTVTYNGLAGIRRLANKLEVQDPYQFVLYQYERSRASSADQTSFLNTYGDFGDIDLYKSVAFADWQDKLLGDNALMQTHNLGLTGGTATTTFNLSVTSNNEDGVLMGSGFDRKLVNFKFDHKVNDKLRAGFNARYNNTIVDGAGTSDPGSASLNRLRQVVKYRPLLVNGQDDSAYDPAYALETNSNSLSLVNPILLNQAEYKKTTSGIANFNAYFSLKVLKELTFKSTLGYDVTNRRDNVFNDSITNESKLNGSGQPMASISTVNRRTINNSNVLSYTNSGSKSDFAKMHKIDALLGQEILDDKDKTYYLQNRLFPFGISPERAFANMSLGTTPAGGSTSTESPHVRTASFFSRVNYAYNSKYLLSLSLRADGSTKFSKGNQWGYFPSGSFAWRITDEKFMEGLKTTVNDLKLRVSYGEAGNNRIRDFLYLSQFTPSAYYDINNQLITTFNSPTLSNNSLKWETTISKNLGLDAGFLNNRVQISIDAYKNKTRDLLVDVAIPTTSGYTTQIQNVGSTSNKGLEFQLNGTPVATKNFQWTANFNISFNKNKIESLGQYQKSFLQSSGFGGSTVPADYQVIVGQAVGKIYGMVTDGFYTIDDFTYNAGVYTLKPGVANNSSITAVAPKPGVLKFKDLNSDGLVDLDHDRQIIGDANPNFLGGLNQSFTYKNWDLSAFVNFQVGNDVLNANKLEFTNGYQPNSNMLAVMNGRWRNVNDQGVVVTDPTALAALNANATIWSPLTSFSSFYVHSWAVEDASFLRINNLTLGYTVPTSLLTKIKVSRLRVYGTVNNLAVITNYSGYDPEVSTRRSTGLTPGVDYSAYPRSRAFIFGVNLSLQ
ncbi:SusC/RagA family TonB-linked outer membrane protein [Hufsiella ginkgonis]|uniref:SusC/RagA family TonB-linked outer membrane protein n=1 Tax=Hufsiella ginkgonis TaxID=2695274 RepID=A0A7K1XTZ4_9SPHI|nr:TonB-dependent receptor [Hufsiella ginkgonis]MXV14475.1 SusC/RagA family TonB-linked outer membrane protein [Hufsiella ginkgonis]